MHAVVERSGSNTCTCSLLGYKFAPIYISCEKIEKSIAEGSSIIYYEGKWLSNKKHLTEQEHLIHKLVNDVFV